MYLKGIPSCTSELSHTIHCRVSLVLPCDHVIDQELWFANTAQHHQKGLDHLLLGWKTIQMQNMVLTAHGFYCHCKVRNAKSTHLELRFSVISARIAVSHGNTVFIYFILGTTKLFFIAATPFYIPTSHPQGFQFLHALADTSFTVIL